MGAMRDVENRLGERAEIEFNPLPVASVLAKIYSSSVEHSYRLSPNLFYQESLYNQFTPDGEYSLVDELPALRDAEKTRYGYDKYEDRKIHETLCQERKEAWEDFIRQHGVGDGFASPFGYALLTLAEASKTEVTGEEIEATQRRFLNRPDSNTGSAQVLHLMHGLASILEASYKYQARIQSVCSEKMYNKKIAEDKLRRQYMDTAITGTSRPFNILTDTPNALGISDEAIEAREGIQAAEDVLPTDGDIEREVRAQIREQDILPAVRRILDIKPGTSLGKAARSMSATDVFVKILTNVKEELRSSH